MCASPSQSGSHRLPSLKGTTSTCSSASIRVAQRKRRPVAAAASSSRIRKAAAGRACTPAAASCLPGPTPPPATSMLLAGGSKQRVAAFLVSIRLGYRRPWVGILACTSAAAFFRPGPTPPPATSTPLDAVSPSPPSHPRTGGAGRGGATTSWAPRAITTASCVARLTLSMATVNLPHSRLDT